MTTQGENETNLNDYFKVIWRWRVVLFGGAFIVAFVAGICTLFMQKTYEAKITIMPIAANSKTDGLGGILSQIGNISLGGMNTNKHGAMIMALLESRSLAIRVIERMDLTKLLFPKRWDKQKEQWIGSPPTMQEAVNALRGVISFKEDKKKDLIVGTIEFHNPQEAADIANTYILELEKFLVENTFTQAKKNRLFIAQQLSKNNKDLLELGKWLNRFYQSGRVSNVESKVDVVVSESPVDISSHNELNSLPDQNGNIAKDVEVLKNSANSVDEKIHYFQTIKDVPQQVYLEYMIVKKELLTKLNVLLTQQYEIAKIDESKEDLAFQVIDKAVPSEHTFRPRRFKVVALSFVTAWIVLLFFVFYIDGKAKNIKYKTVL